LPRKGWARPRLVSRTRSHSCHCVTPARNP
jgi:hypothetical protein